MVSSSKQEGLPYSYFLSSIIVREVIVIRTSGVKLPLLYDIDREEADGFISALYVQMCINTFQWKEYYTIWFKINGKLHQIIL